MRRLHRRSCAPRRRFHATAASSLLLSVACGAPGDAAPGGGSAAAFDLTLDNIHRHNTGVRGVSISPDGRHLAISGSGPDGSGLYLAARGEGGGFGMPRFWLQGSNPVWAPGGRPHRLLGRGPGSASPMSAISKRAR